MISPKFWSFLRELLNQMDYNLTFRMSSTSPAAPVSDKKRLPPGQIMTKGWPVLHAGSVPSITNESWSLRVHGEVENELTINYQQLLDLKTSLETCDIHCVTTWSKFDMQWEGVKFKDLMEIVKPTEKAHFAIFECAQGFTTSLPL